MVSKNVNDTNLNSKNVLLVQYKLKFQERFGAEVDLMYSHQGATIKADDGKDYALIIDYISVPLFARFYASEKLFFQLGLKPGILFKGEVKTDNDDEIKIKDQINSFNLEASLGLGFYIIPKLAVDARYNIGLTNVNHSYLADANKDFHRFGRFWALPAS